MRQSIDIVLGGNSYTLRPLTVGQVRDLSVLLEAPAGGLQQGVNILKIAFARDHAAVTVEDLEASASEIVAAAGAILKLAGFLQDATPGEAPAPDQAGG